MGGAADERREALLARIAASLAPRFDGSLSRQTVEWYVRECHNLLERPSTVGRHLPVLAERFARQRLVALAQSQGLAAKPVPEVLFVCTANAGRSQIAAALTARHAGGRVHVRTAGTCPAGRIDPMVGLALTEIGLDPGMEFPKPLTDEVVAAADVVVTMGCGDACPVYPGKRYQDWLLDEPEDAPLEEVRAIRDHIDERVRELLAELIGLPSARQ
ncbi:Protein-tyrosine-phosphatase [Thermomonospora echinospora]|uniref:Protein-tyrosine-phosphatase n=1 Tax=Thermomonospora echinospora TaxID=1992 RepID=A0A1H6CS08_9ACTN|nr:phosphatase [Thermomonospora echinospora]SEG75819.1 Protein-tyrosine-phosphatase [Thermomonospora echinospora]